MGRIRAVVSVVGARPQFAKAAVFSRQQAALSSLGLREVLVHTGQHYNEAMSAQLIRELELPAPHYNLGVSSSPRAVQVADMVRALQPILAAEKPAAVIVYGDTNSTIAGALSAAMNEIPLLHVEAGERVYQRREWPEEVNRVVADVLADRCCTVSEDAASRLRLEGIHPSRIAVIGDPMFEIFLWAQEKLRRQPFALNIRVPERFILATVHRQENTDHPDRLRALVETLDAAPIPVLLPAHPRLTKQLNTLGWSPRGQLSLLPPCGYLDTMTLVDRCECVVTDSGGLVREAYWAKKPSIVPIESPPWPNIIEVGWSIGVGADAAKLSKSIREFRPQKPHREGLFGDGRVGEKLISVLGDMLAARQEALWNPPAHH